MGQICPFFLPFSWSFLLFHSFLEVVKYFFYTCNTCALTKNLIKCKYLYLFFNTVSEWVLLKLPEVLKMSSTEAAGSLLEQSSIVIMSHSRCSFPLQSCNKLVILKSAPMATAGLALPGCCGFGNAISRG